jgi:hypothetical protein
VHPATAIDFWWTDLLTHSDGLEMERKKMGITEFYLILLLSTDSTVHHPEKKNFS